MSNSFFSANDATGGLNLRASERSIKNNEAFDLMNIELTKNGGLLKSNGYVLKNVSPLAGNPKITGMYHYIQSNGTRYFLVTAGTGLFILNTNGTYTEVYTLLADGADCFFATFNDQCIIVNGINPPLTFDGTHVTTLPNWTSIESTGFPTYVEVWKNRLWFSGNPSRPYRLYWSEPGNPAGWSTAQGAGSVDVNNNDGQKVTGIKTFFDALSIYKERSIHQLLGDSPPGSNGPNEFRIRSLASDIGCVAPKTIINAGNHQYFLAEDRLAALETSLTFGDINTQNVSYKIQPLIDRINRTYFKQAFLMNYQSKDQLWLFYPDGLSEKNNRIAILDYGLNAWTQRNGIQASQGLVIEGIPYTGSYDGNIHRQDFGGSYNGAPIVSFYKTPWYGLGNYVLNKRIRSIDITYFQYGNWNIDLQTALNYQTPHVTFPINQNPTGQAPLWGVAQWNQSQWSSITANQVRQIADIGSGKVVQLQFSNNQANQPFHILGWDITYQNRGLRP